MKIEGASLALIENKEFWRRTLLLFRQSPEIYLCLASKEFHLLWKTQARFRNGCWTLAREFCRLRNIPVKENLNLKDIELEAESRELFEFVLFRDQASSTRIKSLRIDFIQCLLEEKLESKTISNET